VVVQGRGEDLEDQVQIVLVTLCSHVELQRVQNSKYEPSIPDYYQGR